LFVFTKASAEQCLVKLVVGDQNTKHNILLTFA